MNTGQWLGLVTGILFGFLLQKGRVLRFDKQIGAMLLEDMTIFKFMLSAILVGMIGILLFAHLGIITLSHKPMNVGAVLVGGSLFGAGWAIMGFCPGTSLGALGEGRWHAVFAILGMVIGAAVYAELYPLLKSTVLAWQDFGKIGLPEVFGISPWIIVPLFWAGGYRSPGSLEVNVYPRSVSVFQWSRFVQAGLGAIVGYVRRPDRTKMGCW